MYVALIVTIAVSYTHLKLVPDGEKPAAGEAERNVQEQDEPEDHAGPFEV